MGSIFRGLVLVLLAMGMAGFGLFSLCGGAIGVASLFSPRGGGGENYGIGWLAWGCAAVGATLAWLCWRGFKALRGQVPPAGP